MPEVTQQQVVEYIKGISVLELSQLVKTLESELGVSAAAAMPMMAMPGGAGGGAAAPAEEKTDRRPISLAQENILSPGSWEHRRELRATECARYRHQAGHRPGEKQPAGRSDQAGRFCRGNEDARADHRAHHDHGRVEWSETADQLLVRRRHP